MRRSIRLWLLLAFLGPAFVLLSVAGIAGYAAVRGMMEQELGRNLSSIAAATASQVNGARLLTIEEGDDKAETRTYRNVLRTLNELKEAAGARRIVAFDTAYRVRVDAGGNAPTGAELPELARDRLELKRVLEDGQRSESQVVFQKDGVYYKMGYAPVLDEGKVVGAIGVEGSATFWQPFRQIAGGFAASFLAVLAALAAAALLMATVISAPLRRLMTAAERIGKGDLSTPVPPERTREIATLARELEAMRAALESRDRQLKMMLAGVAHEVRNPIGGMELFAGLLSEELPEGDARSHVQRIQTEIDYLKRIVEDFLSFARDQKLALSPVDARELVQTAADLIAADAKRKNVRVEVEAQPATVEADQHLLTAAVVNLVKNAVQASPEGSAVRVTGALADADGYRVRVEDEGGGIPKDVQERIFEPFFTTREKGTGLGLPLARKIAQAHGGELKMTSEPGHTTFDLTVRRAPSPGAAAALVRPRP